MFPWMADHHFEPRLWLVNEAFILGLPLWALMTKTNFFIYHHKLPWQCLLLLRQLHVLRLGPRPNIYIDNELLGPILLQYIYIYIELINNKLHFLTFTKIQFNHLIFKFIHFWSSISFGIKKIFIRDSKAWIWQNKMTTFKKKKLNRVVSE